MTHAPDTGVDGVPRRLRGLLAASATMVVVFLVSLIVRREGSYYGPVDGWAVSFFEMSMGGLCIARYLSRPWRRSASVARAFPIVVGAACICWAVGDLATTVESLGGATPPTPSVADGFFVGFFPLCYLGVMMVIRRGNTGSLVATALDGAVAGLAAAALSAAYVFGAVMKVSGDGALSVATSMAYPVGDLLLLALAIGGLTILPREYRRFLTITSLSMAANAIGDLYNLLQADSKIGYVANAVAWPISLLLLAVATWIQPATARIRRVNGQRSSSDRTAGVALPVVGGVAGIFVLFSATLGHISKPAIALATATLLLAGVRLTLTMRSAQALNSARFRSLIDNAWDLILVAEADFEVAYITPSSERVLGYDPDQLQGKPVTTIAHPDDADEVINHLRHLADGLVVSASFETRMRHQNGEWRIIAWTATNLLSDPSVRGYVLNGGDVTEARRAAEDLAAARDGALMASKAKSDFLSTMSHEIRTPMNAVIGLTELLLGTNLDTDQQELASGVKISAENLLVIINDILDFSKIEAGKLTLEEAALDVASVADDVGRILAPAAHSKGLELLVDVHPEVPTGLVGDTVRIQQVLLNLASNAVKFTAAGEVIVRISLLHHNADRVALRFDVIDMGIGIAAADQQRLFRPFAQADSSTTRKFGGTGLGLAICRQLIELMGGNLGLISAPGQGSTFWFELSLRRSECTPSVDHDADPRGLTGQRALVVDDNATNRKILRRQLQSWGVQVVEAVDAYQALELVAAATQAGEQFDLGVVDLNMPGMDGIELASTLKADPVTAATNLFLLSSSGERLGKAEAHLRGFAASMTKPVRSSELYDCLITSLNRTIAEPSPEAPTAGLPENPEPLGMILLVEDNKMNQLVASKVLAKLGFSFDIANHGREAVSAIRARSYDAILMDCQMPEMDGYEATAEIRRLEGPASRTPIIAMTAAAMAGDRETCLAAGMDDYLTKPIRPEALAASLERWTAPLAHEAAACQDASSQQDEPSPLDRAQVELLRSLDDGDGAVLGEIINEYVSQTTHAHSELVRVIRARDIPALERTAHTLKGASANVGANALAAVCAELEQHARSAHFDDVDALVERFDNEFARVKAALTRLTVGG